MRESGYERMPPIEETLASYLSMGEMPYLKVSSLPSKPLQDTSRLNGKAYAAAGQAVASLHTMAVLQAYRRICMQTIKQFIFLCVIFFLSLNWTSM